MSMIIDYSLILQGSSISTGNWGCGTFGGNPRIKCLVQVLAASIAGVRKLDFYTFGEKDLAADFESALKMMKGQTVGWVLQRIMEFRCKSGPSVLHTPKSARPRKTRRPALDPFWYLGRPALDTFK